MIDLNKAYRITLTTKCGKRFTQYIEADNMDNAAKLARKTFAASLYDFREGWEGQKACDKTKLNESLRFGFKGGWNTIDCTGLTIFQALEKSRHCFGGLQDIEEIMPPVYLT